MEAEGIRSRGVDAPETDWDLGDTLYLLVGRSPNKSMPLNKALPIGTSEVHAQTCYVPHKGTNVHGSPEFQEKILKVCEKHKHVFNTKLNAQPADVPPMELNIDVNLWETNKTKALHVFKRRRSRPKLRNNVT